MADLVKEGSPTSGRQGLRDPKAPWTAVILLNHSPGERVPGRLTHHSSPERASVHVLSPCLRDSLD